jgi:copper chaperone CopZ
MAPLSVLPGRLRFQTNSLIGSKEGCLLIEDSISSVQGVKEASASHRTGSVLVRFDESLVTRREIEKHLGSALQTVAIQKEKGGLPQLQRSNPSRGASASSSGVGHFFMEMALHAFLPAPLDLLLPTAATVFRR